MPDDLPGELVRGARRLERPASTEPRGEIAGIETVAGGGRIDRHHDFRHRHGIAFARSRDQCAVRPVLYDDFSHAEGLQPLDGRLLSLIHISEPTRPY